MMPDPKETDRLRRLEDAYWTARAEEAIKGGFLSPEESMAFLLGRLESETVVAKSNDEGISIEEDDNAPPM
jgi:hypothetical protein